MKPIFQTIINNKTGNCQAACIASILEVPLEEVPNFNEPDSTHYNENMVKFFETTGYRFLSLYVGKDETSFDAIYFPYLVGCHCVVSVLSQSLKNCSHAVVGKFEEKSNGEIELVIAHDPNPSNKPYEKLEYSGWVEFIVKK